VSSARRLETSLVASALLHALVLGAALRAGRVTLRPPLIAFPVALVAGDGAAGTGGTPAAAPAPEPEPASATPAAKPHPVAVARRPRPRLASVSHGTAETTMPGLDGAGAGAVGGGGGGDGGGDTGARAAYDTNPLPPYPLMARRLRKEGLVLLQVLVAADGHAAEVRVLHSSGFTPLDDSALTTVRERWRFIPARRDGVPVESRVTVPIRFRLAADLG